MGLATLRLLVEGRGAVVFAARDEDQLDRRQKQLESFGKGKVETIVSNFYDWKPVKAPFSTIDIETRPINRFVNAPSYSRRPPNTSS
jgi:short-subunit dehydrogenase